MIIIRFPTQQQSLTHFQKETRLLGEQIKKQIGFSENFWFLEKFELILDFFAIDLDFSVIFLDFSNTISNHCTVAWVKRPERPKGVKDEVKQARRAAT